MGGKHSSSRLRLLAVGLAAFAAGCLFLSDYTFSVLGAGRHQQGSRLTAHGPLTSDLGIPRPPGRFLAAEAIGDAKDTSGKSSKDVVDTNANDVNVNVNGEDDDAMAMGIPQNVHLVLIGDSVTRYQYLSLAHFFRYGEWYDSAPDAPSYLVNEHLHESWDDFYLHTSMLLSPFEQCDCHRSEQWNMETTYENRYFYDPARNNSVVYLQKFGDVPFHSHWQPGSDVNMPHTRNGVLVDGKQDVVGPPVFTGDWNEMLSDFVPKLEPKPTHIVLNSGLWNSEAFSKEEHMADLLAALQRNGMKGIYKTTTRKSAEELEWYEKYLCQHMTACLDMTFTADAAAEPTWDPLHFNHGTYEKANKVLLNEKLRTRRRVDVNMGEARGPVEARQILDIALHI